MVTGLLYVYTMTKISLNKFEIPSDCWENCKKNLTGILFCCIHYRATALNLYLLYCCSFCCGLACGWFLCIEL